MFGKLVLSINEGFAVHGAIFTDLVLGCWFSEDWFPDFLHLNEG